MKMDKIAFNVYVTEDYQKFKRLEGNRSVLEIRVKKIIRSIGAVGQIPGPIIVNEDFEVIDGQGRLEAAQRLGLPVYYMIIPNIGIDECIAMNMNQSNWALIDYIESYAETGNASYLYLLQILKEFGKVFQAKVIMNTVTGKFDNNSRIVKSGELQFTKEDYSRSKQVLRYLTDFVPAISRIDGHTEFYYMALAFTYFDPEVDNVRMLEKVNALRANLIPVTTIQQALEQIEDTYNNRVRQKVYIKTNYRKYMDGKYSWYDKKYGEKYKEERHEHTV